MKELNIFLSYTNREEEIKQIKPLIDLYCRDLWEWAKSNDVKIYYDDFSTQKRRYSESGLEQILRDAIGKSHLMTAFLSPSYVESEWCRFEYVETKKKKKPIHGVLWKFFRLNILSISPGAVFLYPEGETDITYLRENPTPEEFERAAKECVENSIELIRTHYRI